MKGQQGAGGGWLQTLHWRMEPTGREGWGGGCPTQHMPHTQTAEQPACQQRQLGLHVVDRQGPCPSSGAA
jgi:hypothetical protein